MIGRELERALLYTALVLGVVLTLAPLLWMLSASLMPAGEASVYPPRLLPSRVTFEHYADLFTAPASRALLPEQPPDRGRDHRDLAPGQLDGRLRLRQAPLQRL